MMEINKAKAIAILFGVIIVCATLFLYRLLETEYLREFWLGLIAGVGLGLFTCIILAVAWKPSAQPNHYALEESNPITKWLPFAVVGGLLASRLAIAVLPPEVETLVTNIVITWLVITVTYMTILRIWKSRLE